MKVYVDQQAISRNSGRQPDEQEPVFIIERGDGSQTVAHGVTITGTARLRYDKTQQPRAWLEASDITEET